jgi:hypothetical protein
MLCDRIWSDARLMTLRDGLDIVEDGLVGLPEKVGPARRKKPSPRIERALRLSHPPGPP